MKLQFEVTHVNADESRIVFKPICSELKGQLQYIGIPRRAVEQFKAGQRIEATITLPDHYPVLQSALGSVDDSPRDAVREPDESIHAMSQKLYRAAIDLANGQASSPEQMSADLRRIARNLDHHVDPAL